jgi:hypothetical protein
MIRLIKNKGYKIESRITWFILLLFSAGLFLGCKRSSKDENVLGDAFKPASANFYVIGNSFQANSAATNTVVTAADFAFDSVYFKANFSESVSWTITVKGQKSGATKVITGLSDSIYIGNSLWTGGPTSTRLFIKGETAVATLSILGYTPTTPLTASFTIFKVKPYNNKIYNGVNYLLIDDFDAGAHPLASVTPDLKDLNVVFTTDSVVAVNGTLSYSLSGNDANWNSYLGAIAMQNLAELTGSISVQDADQLYANIYIYGTGTPQTSIAIELFENEHGVPPTGTLDLSVTDAYIVHIPVSWVGWKLVSVPYSSFKKAPDPKSGGNGNGKMEPWLVSGASVTLESYPTGGKTVAAYVDLFTLTQNGVFVP